MKQLQFASPFLLSDTGEVECFDIECVKTNAHFKESQAIESRRLLAATQWQTSQNVLSPASGLLQGKRLAVKDLFHMSGIPTSAGNPDWLNSHAIPSTTSPVITSLLQSGAQFVGKTQTDELAYSLNGQNKHYGTPVNPKAVDRLPGGSSSGSASAVALSLADIGLGTDTGGSVRVPASYQGLFGLRPTHNAIACNNMVALAPAFDTIGWMTRDINTMHQVARVLLPQTGRSTNARPSLVFLQALSARCEHHSQIVEWLTGKNHSQQLDLITNNTLDPFSLQAGDSFRVLQGNAIWQEHGNWLSAQQRDIATDIQTRFTWCATISASQIAIAKEQQQQVIAAVNQALAHADALVLPTTPGRAPLLNSTDNSLAEYRHTLLNLTALAGLAGLPQLHLPLFHIDNSPCGLSLLGKAGSEQLLIQIAEQLLE